MGIDKNTLIAKYGCRESVIGGKKLLALTPAAIDLLDDEREIINIYGKKDTKINFIKKKGRLYFGKNLGVTIYFLDV